MNKKLQLLLLGAQIANLMATVNNGIFKKANEMRLREQHKNRQYKWRHGTINYIAVGSGGGEPVLLIHGLTPGSSLHEWDNNIDGIRNGSFNGQLAGRRVYALDLLGFGKSDKPDLSYSSYLYAVMINDFIRDVIKEKTFVFASGSSSNIAAAACALNEKAHAGLTLISPAISKQPESWLLSIVKRVLRVPLLGVTLYNVLTSRRFLARTLKAGGYCNPDRVSDELIDRYYFASHYIPGFRSKNKRSPYYWMKTGFVNPMSARLRGFLDVDLANALEKTNIPVLLVFGENDSANPLPYMEDLGRDVNYAIVNQSRRMPHAEQPRKFNRYAVSFIEKCKGEDISYEQQTAL